MLPKEKSPLGDRIEYRFEKLVNGKGRIAEEEQNIIRLENWGDSQNWQKVEVT